ncbi:chromate transporter [Ideonella dechloratans]|uniref:chromate transporter n=1 Tax=Ideonella dechloratans TaxID=36863 RepID=UPI0035B1A3DF
MSAGAQAHRPSARPQSSLHLFLAFSRLSLMGFGGVLPIAQRELVERLGWLTVEEFAELLSIGQVLPGPNVVNLSLMVGDRYFGLRGALAAMTGMLLMPLVLVLVAAALYQQFAAHPAVAGAVRGMGAVSAGLVMAIALKLLPALRRSPLGRARWMLVTLAVVLATGWWRWPLVLVIALVGGVSCTMAWHCLGARPVARRQEPSP